MEQGAAPGGVIEGTAEETREGKAGEEEGRMWEWWSWGAGTHGQLGTGAFQDELLPRLLPPPSPFPLLHLACGGSHSVAALRSGRALTWGNGSSGQLGHGDLQSCCIPIIVKELQSIKIKTVAAGWSHTAFISDDNKLFTCGSGGFGQLGHGNFDSCSTPKRLMWFSSKKVFHAACGMRHTLVLADSGNGTDVYAFGSSKKGQLGIGSSGVVGDFTSKTSHKVNHTCHPHILESLNGCQISSVYANGDHSAAVSDFGDLYIWGRGFGTMSNISLPCKVNGVSRFCQIALGWNHILALTHDGQIYGTASTWQGALNAVEKPKMVINELSCSKASEVLLDQFELLKESAVRWVAAGSEHSVAILSDGSVVSWGWGEHGQLGLGTTNDKSCPEIVADLPKMPDSQVYCGCGFTFLCKMHEACSQSFIQ